MGNKRHAQIDSELIRYNRSATSDPGVTDDSSKGWGVLSRWLNTVSDAHWVCVDATVGAAIWVDTAASGGGGSSTYLALTDTPSSFSGKGGYAALVNTGETAIEFVTAVQAFDGGAYSDTYIDTVDFDAGAY